MNDIITVSQHCECSLTCSEILYQMWCHRTDLQKNSASILVISQLDLVTFLFKVHPSKKCSSLNSIFFHLSRVCPSASYQSNIPSAPHLVCSRYPDQKPKPPQLAPFRGRKSRKSKLVYKWEPGHNSEKPNFCLYWRSFVTTTTVSSLS